MAVRWALALRGAIVAISCLSLWLGGSQPAFGNAANARSLCAAAPDAPGCGTGQASCTTCHTGAPSLNPYGRCLKDALARSRTIEAAAKAVMNQDCDGDGIVNLEEFASGTEPGVADQGQNTRAKDERNCDARGAGSGYNLCGYDPDYAFKKVNADFCGNSPTFEAYQEFKELPLTEKEQRIAATVDSCMKSNFWRGKGGILWDMAGVKVRPLTVVKAGDDGGEIPLADYYDDYNLYIYHHIDDADARGVLTANYYVTRRDGGTTAYTPTENVALNGKKPGVLAVTGSFYNNMQQFVPKDKRAGVLSTSWAQNGLTMFASIPRSTAAHFYRVYLGLDISKNQGLVEPGSNFRLVDYDNKDVTRPACAACHRSLDALTYPFTKYNGLTFQILGRDINTAGGFVGGAVGGSVMLPPFLAGIVQSGSSLVGGDLLLLGEYNENRMRILAKMNATTEPNLAATPSSGFILGQAVNSLPEWGRVAANSKEYARQIVLDYWRYLIGEEPNAETEDEFESLVENLKTKHNYRVRNLLLDLVTRDAYGAP
ncbi:MAG: hypothetical protein FJ146_09190 [Deltaproteobacteria bacterium]|nr:hypothetical protein [Deltaproteobacteria bacterium]